MIWFKCHHRSLSFLCQSLFSFKCSEAEHWGTAVTDSVGWHFAECLNKTSLWVWLCFSSHLICSPLVLKSCRRTDSRPTWIVTVSVPMLNLEPSFSFLNHRLRRESCSSTSAVEKGWGRLPVGFLSKGWGESPWCCVRGPCPGRRGSSGPGETCHCLPHAAHILTPSPNAYRDYNIAFQNRELVAFYHYIDLGFELHVQKWVWHCEGVIEGWLCTGCSYLFSQLCAFPGTCLLIEGLFILCTTTEFSIMLL